MPFSAWLSLLAATVVISFTPGAGAINTMSISLTRGWRRSLWGIIGQQIALIVHIVIAAAGLGVLVASSPVLFALIRYAGAAYLVYLGLRMLFSRPKLKGEGPAGPASRFGDRRRDLVMRGIWVNLLNPKAIVFFLAFIPQFVRLDQPQLPQYLIIAATTVLVDTCVMWFFFAAAAKPFGRFTGTMRGQQVLGSIFGALFIAVAALLLCIR